MIFAGLLFVDDTDLIQVATHADESPQLITQRTQKAVKDWHGAIKTLGGALKPIKCSWCLIAFTFRNGQWEYLKTDELRAALRVPDPDGNEIEIKRLEPKEAVKVVGIQQAVDGNMTKQLKVLTKKADDWGDLIKNGWIPRNYAWQGLR